MPARKHDPDGFIPEEIDNFKSREELSEKLRQLGVSPEDVQYTVDDDNLSDVDDEEYQSQFKQANEVKKDKVKGKDEYKIIISQDIANSNETVDFTLYISRQSLSKFNEYRWCGAYNKKNKGGRVYFKATTNSNIKLHRHLMGCTDYDGAIIDHINRDTFDNRLENMRIVGYKENNSNKKGAINISIRRDVLDGKKLRCRYQGEDLGHFTTLDKVINALNEFKISGKKPDKSLKRVTAVEKNHRGVSPDEKDLWKMIFTYEPFGFHGHYLAKSKDIQKMYRLSDFAYKKVQSNSLSQEDIEKFKEFPCLNDIPTIKEFQSKQIKASPQELYDEFREALKTNNINYFKSLHQDANKYVSVLNQRLIKKTGSGFKPQQSKVTSQKRERNDLVRDPKDFKAMIESIQNFANKYGQNAQILTDSLNEIEKRQEINKDFKQLDINNQQDDGQIIEYEYNGQKILLSKIDQNHIQKYKLDFQGCSDGRARIRGNDLSDRMDLKQYILIHRMNQQEKEYNQHSTHINGNKYDFSRKNLAWDLRSNIQKNR